MSTAVATPAVTPAPAIKATNKASKKSEAPSVLLPDLKARQDRLDELARQRKDIEAEEQILKAELGQVFDAKRMELSRAAGSRLSSIKINGRTFICFHNQMKQFSDDEYAAVEALFTKELAEKYFRFHYTVKGNLAAYPDIVAAINAAGLEFEYTIKATPQLEDDRTLNDVVERLCKDAGIKPVYQFK